MRSIIPAAGPLTATMRPPGSKSITNRAYILAALAHGESRIVRPLRSDDCDRLLAALETLGAEATWDGDDVLITGTGGRFPQGGDIDLGDGGTPTRFMIAAAMLAEAPVRIDGSPRMRERPVAELVDLLRAMGVRIEYEGDDGHLPLVVHPCRELRTSRLHIGTTASSQFISALLLVGPFLPDGIRLYFESEITSRSYVELTAEVLRAFVDDPALDLMGSISEGAVIHIVPRTIEAREFAVPPDASSAIYWLTAACAVPGSRVTIDGLDARSRQPDASLIEALVGAGACRLDGFGSVGLEGPRVVDGFDVDARLAPDGAMALSGLAALASTPSTIRGLRTLRVKETDRLTALATELRRIGCAVEIIHDEGGDDGLVIDPARCHDEPAVIETYNDHRMAMTFAIVGLRRGGISIRDPECVGKSYPGFWHDFDRLQASVGPAPSGERY